MQWLFFFGGGGGLHAATPMQRHTVCWRPHDLHTSPGQVHHMREGHPELSALERYTDWRPRNHMAELSMYYVAGRKIDQLLREDTFDMIWILKIYQRANKTHGCLQILCWEMCVKSPERCFIQEGQGALWLFDMMQEYFYFVFVAHL